MLRFKKNCLEKIEKLVLIFSFDIILHTFIIKKKLKFYYTPCTT